MNTWNKLRPLLAPALATVPLAVAPPALFVFAEGLVAAAWVGLPLCALYRGKGLFITLAALTALTVWYAYLLQPLELYWLITCAISLGCSLMAYLSLTENKVEQKIEPQQVAVNEPDPELLELRKQVQGLVQWQYRAIEAEQALEQERYQVAQCRAALEADKKEPEPVPAPVQESVVEEPKVDVEELLRAQKERLDEEKAKVIEQLAALRSEHADLSTCYEHLNKELLLLQTEKPVEEKEEAVCAPADLYTAWQEADREHRKFKGLYVQLREQFDAQTKALDDSRRERFYAEEAVNQGLINKRESELEESFLQIKAWEKLTAALVAREEEIARLEEVVQRQSS